MSDDGACCGNCHFFKRIEVARPGGFCRSRAPQPLPVGVTEGPHGAQVPLIYTYWPQVPDTEWCGDHQYRKIVARTPNGTVATLTPEGIADDGRP